MCSIEQLDVARAGEIDVDSSRSHIRKLPQELLDIVVDFLHADKASLRACALALREWLYPARRHLFHTLYIRGSLGKFLTFIRCAPLSITTQIWHLQLGRPGYTRLCDIADIASHCPALYSLLLVDLTLPQIQMVPYVVDYLVQALNSLDSCSTGWPSPSPVSAASFFCAPGV